MLLYLDVISSPWRLSSVIPIEHVRHCTTPVQKHDDTIRLLKYVYTCVHYIIYRISLKSYVSRIISEYLH